VTGNSTDRFKFRTPSLRNVALSAPYGHSGAYDSLEAVLRHHLDPINSLHAYEPEQATLPPRADLDELDFIVMQNQQRRQAIADSSELTSHTTLKEKEVQALLAFLHALTDPAALDMRAIVPAAVPSGLPLWD
jgi:cytochrome c peroxidase